MGRARLFLLVLLLGFWVPIVSAVALQRLETSLEKFLIRIPSTEFVAVGKLVMGKEIAPGNVPSNPADLQEWVESWLKPQLEFLEGRELRARTLERVRGLHPELKEVEVRIHAAAIPKSSDVQVSARGSHHIYPRVYLDSLLDEFMAVRTQTKEADHLYVAIKERPDRAVPAPAEPVHSRSEAAVQGGVVGFILLLALATFISLLFGKKKPVYLPTV
jgi:hypothetical protein